MSLFLTPETYQNIVAHALADEPRICIGVIVARDGRQECLKVANVQDELHAADPVRHPRDARTSWQIRAEDLFDVTRQEERGVIAIRAEYHSYTGMESARMSDGDRRGATFELEAGRLEPTYEGWLHLIIAVRDQRVRDMRVFQWSSTSNEFVEIPFRVDAVSPQVEIVSASPQVLDLLRRDVSSLHRLNPEEFEVFVCERLTRMGYAVERVGNVYARDGGIDIVASPQTVGAFPYLLGVQVKHHRDVRRRTGASAVKDLQAVIANQPFNAGVLVTNTSFTADARWFAGHRPHLLRLREFKDLQRWIWDNFLDDEEWRELPASIELCPGITVQIPRRGGLTRPD